MGNVNILITDCPLHIGRGDRCPPGGIVGPERQPDAAAVHVEHGGDCRGVNDGR
jgi:hypothetical protein